MTTNVIAVANMKGGVGKTATVVMLAEALAAAERKPVLVVDVDAQANASLCLAGDQKLASLIQDGRTLDAFLDDHFLGAGKVRFSDCVHHNVSDVSHGSEQLPVSLLASSPELRLLEREIVIALTERKLGFNAIVGHLFRLLEKQLRSPGNPFAHVLIDCAPGISALTEASIRLADLVIVPTIPDYLSTAGLQAFCNSFWKGSRLARPVAKNMTKPRVLITRRRQTREHHDYADRMRNERFSKEPSFVMFKTEVPEAIAIAEALGKTGNWPTLTNKWGPAIVPVLGGLVKETKEALNGA
jgi:chromosome partitioning protein